MSDTINNNTKQFLDKVGLLALWDKICETIGIAVDKYIPETVNITYDELVELRNSHALKPGEKYRITDYVTTVKSNQLDVISGNHRFDIVVEALDNSTLSEHANAVRHEDDWYFETENLEAWQLWYCLDNDKKRFEWADDGSVNYKAAFIGAYTVDLYGNNKGEYRIDKDYAIYEWNVLPHPDTGDDCIVLYAQDPRYYNEVGVDYRDVYFYEGIITVDGQEYDSWKKYDNDDDIWVTVSYDNFRYYCLLTERMVFNDEVIWPSQSNISKGKGVIYRMIDEYGNDCPYDFKNVKYYCEGMGTYVYTFTWIDEEYNVMDTSVFGNNGALTYYGEIYGVRNNVIKPYYVTDDENIDGITERYLCKQFLNNITFISDYSYEYIGNDGFNGCYHNSFGNDCTDNSFGNSCYSNSFGNSCSNNSFGNDCTDNSFGNEFRVNHFIGYCSCNYFGNGVHSNSFGTNCTHNSFGTGYRNNSFGNDCRNNSFGNDCTDNSFGNDCTDNSFGNGCCNNKLMDHVGGQFAVSCKYNRFDDGCSYNTLHGDSQNGSFCNLHVVRGVSGNADEPNYINVTVSENATYEIKVAKNSNGEIKVYCEADLIA